MAWVAPVVAAGASLVGSAMQSSNNKAGGSPSYMAATMPDWLRSKFEGQMQGMPGSINVQFGGGNYPSPYGPLMRTASKMYTPAGVIPYQNNVSPMTGAMAAAAPYAWMMAQQQQQAQSPQAQANLGYSSLGFSSPYMGYSQIAPSAYAGGLYGSGSPYAW